MLLPCAALTAALRDNSCPLTYLSISSALLQSKGGTTLKNNFITGRQVPSVPVSFQAQLLQARAVPFHPLSPAEPAPGSGSCCGVPLRSCTQQTPTLPPAPSRPLPPAGLPAPQPQMEPANKIILQSFSLLRYRIALLTQEWFWCLQFPLKLLRLFIQSSWN